MLANDVQLLHGSSRAEHCPRDALLLAQRDARHRRAHERRGAAGDQHDDLARVVSSDLPQARGSCRDAARIGQRMSRAHHHDAIGGTRAPRGGLERGRVGAVGRDDQASLDAIAPTCEHAGRHRRRGLADGDHNSPRRDARGQRGRDTRREIEIGLRLGHEALEIRAAHRSRSDVAAALQRPFIAGRGLRDPRCALRMPAATRA
jgi:hypothetical protein